MAAPCRHALLGAVVGLAIIAVLLHVRAEASRSSSALDSLRHADRRLVLVAILLETFSYVLPGLILRRLVPELSLSTALRITLASLGVGQLLPGNPATGSGIAFAELRRRQIPARRAAPISVALVIALPAASMALLAAPTLLASGIAGPLPAGWRGVVLIAGAVALALAVAITWAVARGAREDRAGRAIAALGGRRDATVVLLLQAGLFAADAGSLWTMGRALHVGLPLGSLPVAYSYARVVIVVLAWRVLSFWLPTAGGLAALASLHRRRRVAA